jgi:SAM-dependent methyltransferase
MVALRFDDGEAVPLGDDRWHQAPDAVEVRLLASLPGPVLDVGCGPGRLVAELARRGVPALGVDPAPLAVALARQRGATVLQRSVFDRLPGEGRWQTVILLDGNVGIGGDAVRLLRRCRRLGAPDGVVLVEVEPPGTGWRTPRVRLERGDHLSPWFPWALVGADAIGTVADDAGLRVAQLEHVGGRWFAHLCRSDATA